MSQLDTKNDRDGAFAALVNSISWCFNDPDQAKKKFPVMIYGSCDLDYDLVRLTLKKALYGDEKLNRIEDRTFNNRAALIWRDAALSKDSGEGPQYLQWEDKSMCVPELRFYYYSNAWKAIEVVNDILMGVDVTQRHTVDGYETLDEALSRKLVIFTVKDHAFKCMVWKMMDLSGTVLGQRFYDLRYSAIDFCCTAATNKYFDVDLVQDLVSEMPNCSIIKWDQKHIENQLKSRIGQLTQSNKHLHSDPEIAKGFRNNVLSMLKEWIKTPNHIPAEDPMNQVQIIWRGNVFPMSDLECENQDTEGLWRIVRLIEDILAVNPIQHDENSPIDVKEALKRRITIVYRKPSYDRIYVSDYTFVMCTVEEFIHSTAFLLLDEYVRCAYRKIMQ